ncbi:MAG: DNA/RNA non-specific endonuclease [Candidatus Rifleibacteriota bacterium]
MNIFKRSRQGKIGQNQLILLILLVTAIGLAIYYVPKWMKSRSGQPPAGSAGPFECPIEPELAEATKQYRGLVYGGAPKSGKLSLTILRNIGYYSAYSEEKRCPLWVAYRLDGHKKNYNLKRPDKFKVDMRTSSRITPNDYKSSGYDRGHMAPNSAIMAEYGKEAQLETFLMSNICPQSPELNRKVWQKLERLESEYADNLETVWVITGPVFDEHIQTIKNRIEVPDAFFKILFDEQQGNIRYLAFLIPQTVKGNERLDQFITSIDEIEKLTGLDFLAPLSDENEERLESTVPNRMW